MVIWVKNLTHFKFWKVIQKESIFVQFNLELPDFRGVNMSWIPETHILLIINNFTETFCDVDDWIFHCLSLCLSPFSVYHLCHFVTVCTVNKMWAGGYVTVIFHILSIRNTVLDRLEHAKKGPKNLANTFSDALVILKKKMGIAGASEKVCDLVCGF